MSEQQYPALWQFLGAYLHQDWREEYESPSAALRDFVSGDPGFAVDLPTEIEQFLSSTADDAALEARLVDLGSFFLPSRAGQNPRDWLRSLRDETQLWVDSESSRLLGDVRALLESTQRGEVTLAEFEPRFLRLHAEMPLSTPEASAEAIEDLFWVVEGFVAEPTLRTASDPDDHALLEAIGRCLTRIGS
jgi:AcrR family transcriptional regulator